jgi:hypothetical protein
MEGTPSKRPVIWLVGDSEHPDFTDVVSWLQLNCECRAPETGHADSPGAIVALQSRPGSISVRFVESLHCQAPLARLISLNGPWCDGELRTGRLPAGVVRIRWHQWRQQLPAELSRGAARLPRTATEADRLEHQLRELADSARGGGRIGIRTALRDNYLALADACTALGWRAEWAVDEAAPSSECDLELIDGWEQMLVRDEVLHGKPLPRVLLLEYPRPDGFNKAAELGVHNIVAKPFTLPVLAAALTAAAPRALRSAVQPSVA